LPPLTLSALLPYPTLFRSPVKTALLYEADLARRNPEPLIVAAGDFIMRPNRQPVGRAETGRENFQAVSVRRNLEQSAVQRHVQRSEGNTSESQPRSDLCCG